MILNKSKIIEFFLIVLISALAFTDIYAFKIGDKSFSFYIILGLLFIITITCLRFKFPTFKNKYAALILMYILFSSLLNFTSLKATSIVYSILFIFYYVYLTYYSKEHLPIQKFIFALKFILISFFVILICAQFLVLFDLQEFSSPEGYFQSVGQFGTEYNNRTNSYRYFSLSSEPSYASIIVLISFACLNELINKKKELYLYGLLTLYMLFCFKSSIGFIGLFFLVITQVKISKKHFLIFTLIIIVAVLLFFFTEIGGKSVDRIREMIFVYFSESGSFIENLNKIDSGAYARLGPLITYIQDIEILNYHTYLGYGASSSEAYFSKVVYPEAWNTDMVFKPPFLPGFLYDFGLLGVFIVGKFLFYLWGSKRSVFYGFIIIAVLLNSNFNTQLFWFVLIIVSLNNFYTNRNRQSVESELVR